MRHNELERKPISRIKQVVKVGGVTVFYSTSVKYCKAFDFPGNLEFGITVNTGLFGCLCFDSNKLAR